MLMKKRSTVGLDIGESCIKLVALQEEGRKQRYKLIKYAIRTFENHTTEEAARDDVVVEAIKQIYRKTRLDEKKVRVALSGSSVVVRYVSIPAMSIEEAKQNIKYEGAQHIPFDIDDVEIDCDIIKNGSESQKMEVIIAAVRKEACSRLMGIVEKAGLTPVIVDVNSVALMNAFNYAHVADAGEAVAVVNIGAHNSEINVLHSQAPVFSRILEIGGNEVTAAIGKGLGIDLARAEELKMFGDIIIKPFVEKVLEEMVRNFRSSFDYYEGMSGTDVNRIYLSGGGALYEDMRVFMQNSLGIPAELWDPFAQIDTTAFKSDKEFQSLRRMFTVAVGLAIRRLET